MSYRELGRCVDLSIGAVRARLARLMQNGMLRIACEVKEQDAARRIQLGAGIRLRGETTHLIDTLRSLPAVKFAALSVGHFDVIVTTSGPASALFTAWWTRSGHSSASAASHHGCIWMCCGRAMSEQTLSRRACL